MPTPNKQDPHTLRTTGSTELPHRTIFSLPYQRNSHGQIWVQLGGSLEHRLRPSSLNFSFFSQKLHFLQNKIISWSKLYGNKCGSIWNCKWFDSEQNATPIKLRHSSLALAHRQMLCQHSKSCNSAYSIKKNPLKAEIGSQWNNIWFQINSV